MAEVAQEVEQSAQTTQQQAQQPAPEPQQAAPAPAPTPEPQQPQEAPQEPEEQVGYEETGDPTLDYVLGYLADHKLGADHPAVQAATKGDFAQLEVELAKRDAKGYDKVLQLAQRSYESFQAGEQEKAEATQQAIFEVVGGEEEWQAIQSWAAENAEPEEKEAINELFGKGGFHARLAADFLNRAYRDASGTEYTGKPAAGDAAPAGTAKGDTGPISRKELAQKGQELYRKYGDDYIRSPEYRALARRVQR